MTRIGPNQDVNDPYTIIDLAYDCQQRSNAAGNSLAQSVAQNPTVNGPPIVNVSIPFKMIDGSTQLMVGNDISPDGDGGYVYDMDLVSDAVIVTYIDLAERFRNYWESLNNVLDQLSNYDYLQETDMESEGPTVIPLYGGLIRTLGSLGGTEYTLASYSHSPPHSLSVPTWDGIGPTDYNQLTYPQLLSQLSAVGISRHVSSISWDTTYWYDKYTDDFGDIRYASAYFGYHYSISDPPEKRFVQFYNNGASTLDVELSINIVATFDVHFSASYWSVAEIGNLDDYPTGQKYLMSSYESHEEAKPSPGGTITLNINRTVEIPPGKSAFISCGAKGGTTFGSLATVGTVNITVILDGETLLHSANLT